jgi:hypothetical protein
MTETLKYTLVKKENEFELRQYAAHIKAEVTIEAKNYRLAVENAFGILAGYIFGNNISSHKIAMTTPVTTNRSEKIAMTTPVMTNRSEKIAMTTPVTISGGGSYTVAFIMPSEYNLSSLPLPGDKRVKLMPVLSYQAAVIRFNGYFNEEKIARNRQRLTEWIKEQGQSTIGEFTVAGYSPPWVPGFLARNEVLVRVQ